MAHADRDLDLLVIAAHHAGIALNQPRLIRNGSNILYQANQDLVARIGRPGTISTATRELAISTWLADNDLPVVTAARATPTIVSNRPVTWWTQLPPHRPATPAELAASLRALHQLPLPTNLDLPAFDPFEGLAHRIDNAGPLLADDRTWLHRYLDSLRIRYADLPDGRPHCAIHGDAWQGNIAVPTTGPTTDVPILLDLEHISLGPPEWDLTAFTADHTDFDRTTTTDYHAFINAYGQDLTTWPGYRTFADIQELRWLAFILTKTLTNPDALAEARHRIACLQGRIPRPWTWTAF